MRRLRMEDAITIVAALFVALVGLAAVSLQDGCASPVDRSPSVHAVEGPTAGSDEIARQPDKRTINSRRTWTR